MIEISDLKAICLLSPASRLEVFVDPLNETMKEFEIDKTPTREAMFLAQIAHESGGFRYVRELASGEAYEGRADLGNDQDGDGVRYKGRGLIQITGKANYRACGDALGLDFVSSPELLEDPANATRSAGWFWAVGAGLRLSHRALAHGIKPGANLNDLADAGDFDGITLAINGGLNGLAERQAYLKRADGAFA